MEVEFRIIDDEELPAVIIKENASGNPEILINNYHRLWLCLQRGTIAGIFEVFPKKLTDMLDAYLREQYQYEVMDRGE